MIQKMNVAFGLVLPLGGLRDTEESIRYRSHDQLPHGLRITDVRSSSPVRGVLPDKKQGEHYHSRPTVKLERDSTSMERQSRADNINWVNR
ncbi:MAG: hypothetical protein MMC33_004937 [Icmadophila ericetorum]|nr:hypothetical protein [Icmadophila ericetorum]